MEKSILSYLERSENKFPNKVAFSDGKYELTYHELVEEAKSIGSFLIENIGMRKAVVVYMEKGSRNISAFMGAAYAGCFYVPLDAQMPVERINIILDTLKPAAIIYDDKTEKYLSLIETDCIKVLYDEIHMLPKNEEKLVTARRQMIDTDPLYVLFTSGSTGIPKGVIVCHRSVIDYADWVVKTFELNENTTFGNQTPFYFSMSVLDIFATIRSGATLYIIPKMLFSFPVKLLEFLKEKEVNTIYWVPSALSIVANLGALDVIKLPDLKKILFAGETMPTKQLNIWRRHVPDAVYANLFGPTEITDIGIYYIVDREFNDDEPIPIGVTCDNVDALVVDEDGQLIEECGKVGELLIRGSFLACGYYNNPEKTREAFIQNPLNKSYPETVYCTGDLVYWNENRELVYVSRKDFQIKHMGNRIELGEIENAMSALEGVDMCCCLYNKESDQIVAVYSGSLETKKLSQNLKKKLPRYMLPNVCYNRSSMPLNMNGKIDRKKLIEEYIK
ncbi:amino acid adenylation domain-containing protein [Clostridium beijerinckii]|jgi:Non-ribosomal peptide synthetase modules and related proteins|uniref:Amino acid adenylation domain-containing protein n=2 Tax=Clostridium beijerinckii TaxID=1520 RepID=A0AAE2RX82_CLOBE|nr:amino acid adenylation domain-containing protein [Clostridium beijerinckii]ABR33273.1 AMP-dependent synthetase and ligase [Clostridium beijerinckii NCIMB 8052]AIU01812.1 AMP-dependent synthetase and ligase [Clostridium beijerinckii ATCC 35702]MBF7811829.1 amino acid adenylation domain-containing protein [Clostridium beijerinckii]NRT25477.1 amino acid adenylation domain-containing protein [Clostridium beijerinckii]NRT66928.1 amino acid adenylation domain-containing protein [Clostridium beije